MLLRYVVRTPFGLALQGVRDDPVRMSSLGYNVVLHRTLAFGFAAFVASLGGVLFVWWNGHIDPASIDLSAMIDVLVIAVIGGLYRVEAAWLGAFVFVIINNYSQQDRFRRASVPHADRRHLSRHRARLAHRPDRALGALPRSRHDGRRRSGPREPIAELPARRRCVSRD